MTEMNKCKECYLNTIDKFAKRIEELKAQVEQLSYDNHVLKTSFITQQEKIEKMKCCENCKHSYTDSENVVFCRLPISQENCKSCKFYKHEETDKDYWEWIA